MGRTWLQLGGHQDEGQDPRLTTNLPPGAEIFDALTHVPLDRMGFPVGGAGGAGVLAASGGLGPSAAGGGFGLDMSWAPGGNVPALGVQGQTSPGLFALWPIHVSIHACIIRTRKSTCSRHCGCMRMHARSPACVRSHMHAQTQTHACTKMHMHICCDICMHACTHILAYMDKNIQRF